MSDLNIRVDGKEIKIDEGKVRLSKLAKMLEDDYQGHICMAKIKNRYRDLNYVLHTSENVHLIDTRGEDGMRLYFSHAYMSLVVIF